MKISAFLWLATSAFQLPAMPGIHDPSACFVYHTDLHLSERDLNAGARADADELADALKIVNPDWVQIDAKGHPGFSSWKTKVKEGRVAPHLRKDAIAAWREATRRLGLPLVCHYSGVVDVNAAIRHPEWRAVLPDGQPTPDPLGHYWRSAMCPRSGYWSELVIPELVELARDYGVDGFWSDGDVWAFCGCWCEKCRKEFSAQTGIKDIPVKPEEPHWKEWWGFQRDSFLAAQMRCRDAVRAVNPKVKYASNWLDTLGYPLPDGCEADWYSGDLFPKWSLDQSRCEVRWLSNRGKPWDMMSWLTTGAPDFRVKSVDMLCQEAVQAVAAGGVFSGCEQSCGIRASQQVKWRLKRYARVGEFLRARAPFCRGARPIPEVAVLNAHVSGDGSCAAGSHQALIVRKDAVCAMALTLLDCRYGVDILGERDLVRRMAEFDVVAVPENSPLSSAFVEAARRYVECGGRLLLAGTKALKSFGPEFCGIADWTVETNSPLVGQAWTFNMVRDETPIKFVGTNAAPDEVFCVKSKTWGLVSALISTAEGVGRVFESDECDQSGTAFPAAVFNRRGRGAVLSFPADCFVVSRTGGCPSEFRRFVGQAMRKLLPARKVEVETDASVDILLREKDGALLVHLLNLSTGRAISPEQCEIDDIPPVGPIRVSARLPSSPETVTFLPDGKTLPFEWKDGRAEVVVPSVRIHGVVAFSCRRVRSPEPSLRFGVVSDPHVGGPRKQVPDLLEKSLRWLKARRVDAVVFPGDITDNSKIPQLEAFSATWEKVFPGGMDDDGREIVLLPVTGNHDARPPKRLEQYSEDERLALFLNYRDNLRTHWRRLLGREWEPVWLQRIKGFAFVGAQWKVPGGQIAAFLEAHAGELEGERPFFFFQHEVPRGTCSGNFGTHNPKGCGCTDDGTSTRALSSFPNAVAFSGHSHNTLADESSVWQGAFTAVNAGCLHEGGGKFCYDNMSAKWVPDDLKRKPMAPLNDPVCWGGDPDGGCFLLVEVFDDHLRIQRRSSVADLPIGDSWTVPLPARAGGPFDFARLASESVPPEFPADATVEIEALPGGSPLAGVSFKGRPCVSVRFPAARRVPGGNRVFDYVVTAEGVPGKDVRRTIQAAGFSSPEAVSVMSAEAVFMRDEFSGASAVRFTVVPRDSFGKCGRSIVSTTFNL